MIQSLVLICSILLFFAPSVSFVVSYLCLIFIGFNSRLIYDSSARLQGLFGGALFVISGLIIYLSPNVVSYYSDIPAFFKIYSSQLSFLDTVATLGKGYEPIFPLMLFGLRQVFPSFDVTTYVSVIGIVLSVLCLYVLTFIVDSNLFNIQLSLFALSSLAIGDLLQSPRAVMAYFMLYISFTLFCRQRYKAAFLIFLVATFSHQSSLIYCSLFIFAWFANGWTLMSSSFAASTFVIALSALSYYLSTIAVASLTAIDLQSNPFFADKIVYYQLIDFGSSFFRQNYEALFRSLPSFLSSSIFLIFQPRFGISRLCPAPFGAHFLKSLRAISFVCVSLYVLSLFLTIANIPTLPHRLLLPFGLIYGLLPSLHISFFGAMNYSACRKLCISSIKILVLCVSALSVFNVALDPPPLFWARYAQFSIDPFRFI